MNIEKRLVQENIIEAYECLNGAVKAFPNADSDSDEKVRMLCCSAGDSLDVAITGLMGSCIDYPSVEYRG